MEDLKKEFEHEEHIGTAPAGISPEPSITPRGRPRRRVGSARPPALVASPSTNEQPSKVAATATDEMASLVGNFKQAIAGSCKNALCENGVPVEKIDFPRLSADLLKGCSAFVKAAKAITKREATLEPTIEAEDVEEKEGFFHSVLYLIKMAALLGWGAAFVVWCCVEIWHELLL